MTQTNQWGAEDTVATAWGDDTETSTDNAWGDGPTVGDNDWGEDPQPAEPRTSQWGDDIPTQEWNTQPAAPAAWGDTIDSPSVDSDNDLWSRADAPAPGGEGADWSPSGLEDPLDRFETEEPHEAKKLSLRLKVIIAAVVVVLVGGGFLLVNLLGSGGAEEDSKPVQTSAAAEDSGVPAELQQFEPFSKSLQSALNNRDAKAYYSLISKESQGVVKAEVAEEAVKNLPAGAQYEVKLVNGSAAGDTATVKLTLVRTLAGDTSEQNMTTQLVKEGDAWKMVVKANDQ